MMNNQMQEQGFFAKMKDWFRLDTLTEKIKSSRETLIDVVLYGGIGFIIGFLLKKYSTYIFVFILTIVGIIVLQQFGVLNISVNADKLQELFGIQKAAVSGETMLSTLWEWIKANLVISISLLIGFILGLKIG